MAHEMLLEIGTEEIPAGFIDQALGAMGRGMAQRLEALSLAHGDISLAATPRRLAVCVAALAGRQPDTREEILGPPRKVAFTPDGRPSKAAEGFARSQGVGIEELAVMTTPKGEYLGLVKERPGKATPELLTVLLPEFILSLPFPKSMHWGADRITFARPLQWIVALYDREIVPFRLGSLASGDLSRGHRFMAPEPVPIRDCNDYLDLLRSRYVLADREERKTAVMREIEAAAASAGGSVLADEELLGTVTNLVEYPVGVCGAFDRRFLALPRSVLVTSMREHQKYFCVVDREGALLPNFVAVNNTRVKDARVTTQGHQRVLRARLEDALFFFEEDRKTSLAGRVEALSGVVFQARLGTLLEKTGRLQALTEYLAGLLAPRELEACRRAAYLAKADLLTAMVNEFPSLQGVIGKEYALMQDEGPAVATAIEEHYLPIRAGGRLPATIPGALVALADKIDTIVGCFGIGAIPTGTADPFGLRRLALGLLRIIADLHLGVPLAPLIDRAIALYGDKLTEGAEQTRSAVIAFLRTRFANDMTSRGFSWDVVEAATAGAFADVEDTARRIEALAAVKEQPTFDLLAIAFKRVMNILKGERKGAVDPAHFLEEAEQGLYDALLAVREKTVPLLDRKDYHAALAGILQMKEPVDLFFDKVMVMTEDLPVRRNRLALLAAVADLFLRIGDISKIQTTGG